MINSSLHIGWREWISLPQLGIPAIKAKIDTGARTSCLHTSRYEEFESEGIPMVRFDICPIQKDTQQVITCEAPLVDKRIVTDSGGHKELRPVISAEITLGQFNDNLTQPLIYKIEITLSNRESMLFRMLIGRTAMQNRLTVNPALSYTQGKPDAEILKYYYPKATS